MTNAVGRPACAVLPLTIGQQMTSLSFGCMGNRVYTRITDGDLYIGIPGAKYALIVERALPLEARESRVEAAT